MTGRAIGPMLAVATITIAGALAIVVARGEGPVAEVAVGISIAAHPPRSGSSQTDVEGTAPLPAAAQPTLVPVASSEVTAPRTVEEFLDRLEAQGLFHGAVLVQHGDTIWRRGFGLADREAGIPNDTETIISTGSITKQFTGAGIAKLEMDGLLSVDDPISMYLPGLPLDKADITVHELLTHSAGFASNPAGRAGKRIGSDDYPIGREEFLTTMADLPLLFEPGTQFSYSNAGYSLLAMIIEEVSGVSYEEYLRRELFLPAGMYNTGYILADWSDDVVAVGYSDRGDVWGRPPERQGAWDTDGPYWNLKGNGGIMSSVEDMFRWHLALIGDDILDEAAKDKYQARHILEGTAGSWSYGYGWSTIPSPTGGRLITHNGGNGVFEADFLRFIDDDITIYFATNSARWEHSDIAYEIAEILFGRNIFEHAELSNTRDTTPCGFASLRIDGIKALERVAVLPDSAAGRTTTAWLEVLADGDAADRLRFAANHLGPELASGIDPAELAATIATIQPQLAGAEVTEIYQPNETTFHIITRTGSDAEPGPETVISVGYLATDPTRLHCFHLSS